MKTDSGVADNGSWRECAPGELSEFAAQHRHRQQRRALLRNLSIAVAGFAAVGIAGVLSVPRREKRFAPGGLVCDEVTRLLPAYVANQLDAKRVEQVRKHLASCEHCTERLKKLQQASSSLQS
jgi:hypothetical protein